MSEYKHFEEVWEACEQFAASQTGFSDSGPETLIREISLKVGIYQSCLNQPELKKEEFEKIKSHLLGEILFSMAALSMKENINTFSGLLDTLQYKKTQV